MSSLIAPFFIETEGGGGSASVSDIAYNAATWNGVTDVAPSKNAVRDKFETLHPGIPIAVAGGTGDAITADYTPDVTLTDKNMVIFVASAANTLTNPTFAPDGLTARTIVKKGGVALVAGDIPGALAVCFLEYNLTNTRWELLNPAFPIVLSDSTSETSSVKAATPTAVKAAYDLAALALPKLVAIVTDGADGNVAVSELNGQVHQVTGAYTRSLPTAAIGYNAIFESTTAAVYHIDLQTGTDIFILNGVALTAGNKISSGGSAYERLYVECQASGYYEAWTVRGVFADGGA